jgi:hypothetical protein
MSTRTPAPPLPPAPARPGGVLRWRGRVLGFCLVIFAFELGLFLLVFPWLRNWDLSWIPLHSPRLSDIWMSRYFRGALSGLGLLNIYVALAELVRQLKSVFGEARQ